MPILPNRSPQRTSSVKVEFSLWVMLLLGITIATLTWFVLRLESRALTQEVTRRGVALAQYMAAHSIDPFLAKDTLVLATLVADMMKNEDVVYALISDANGRLAATNRSEEIGKLYIRPPGAYPLDRPEPRIHSWQASEYGKIIDIGIPLILEGKAKIGEVHLGISRSTVERVVRSAWKKVMGLAALFLLAGLVGSIVLVSLMLRPVSELAQGVQAIGKGDLEYQIPAMRQNELGQLATTFNRMTRELHEATERKIEQERIQKELQVARQIQQMLLPKHCPVMPGFSFGCLYRAAKEVGGDYYDFFPVGKGRELVGVTVADVCGKGVPAAMLMSVARSILKSVAPQEPSPAKLLQELNRLLLSDLRGGLFITMFYAVLDARKRMLTYASAGHNPVLLWRPGTDEFQSLMLEPPCLPLGLDGSEMFTRLAQERDVSLKKDDVVILYTDGVTEAMNEKREEFGLKGIMASVRRHGRATQAEEIIRGLEQDITSFCGEMSQSDDIAVVAIRTE